MDDRRLRIASLGELGRHVREDWVVNGRSVTKPGFQAMLVYRFGVWKQVIRQKPLRVPFGLLYQLGRVFVRNFYGIDMYDTATIGRRFRIAHQSGIVIHPDAVIGDDCLIRQGVSIGRGPNYGGGAMDAAPVLGDRVAVGAGAVLIGGIKIGDDVVIGPNAVVMSNVPAGSIVAAPPGRVFQPPARSSPPAGVPSSGEAGQPPAPDSARV
jgi:serine O-acetyltransferase